MRIKHAFIVAILSMFVWQGVADAASISTRVRILESKVAKHDKEIKMSEQSRQDNNAKVDKGLAKIQALENKLTKILKEEEKQKNVDRTDKRYAFP